jgi:hypothetical protein
VSGALWRTLRLTNPIKSMIHTVRRVKGHRDLPKLIAAIGRELNPTPTEEAAALIAA